MDKNCLKITQIKRAGRIWKWIEVNVSSSVQFAKQGDQNSMVTKFIFSNGKTSKICAISTNQNGKSYRERLLEGKSYKIRGSIFAKTRNRTYSSESTSNFDLNMGKIEIEEIIRTPPKKKSKPVIVKDNIAYFKTQMDKAGKEFLLKKLTIKDGTLYRYMGCETCTTAIRYPDNKGKYFCSNRKCPEEKKRKICMSVKNITLKDASGELDGVILFDDSCRTLPWDDKTDFCDDLEVNLQLQKFFNVSMNITLSIPKTLDRLLSTLTNKTDNPYNQSFVIRRLTLLVAELPEGVPSLETPDPDVPEDNEDDQVCNDQVGDTNSSLFPAPSKLRRLQVNVKRSSGPAFYLSQRDAYELPNQPSGLVLLINNCNFSNKKYDRPGSEFDLEYMKELLRPLNFEIFENGFINVKSKELSGIIERFKKQLVVQAVTSCMVVIMSHGFSNEVLMTDGVAINVWRDLVYEFSNDNFPKFDGKPKIFLIAACQEFKSDCARDSMELKVSLSDVLVCEAALPGHYAKRTPFGTQFIRSFVKIVMSSWVGMELQALLRLVQEDMNRLPRKKQQLCAWRPFLFNPFYFKHKDNSVTVPMETD